MGHLFLVYRVYQKIGLSCWKGDCDLLDLSSSFSSSSHLLFSFSIFFSSFYLFLSLCIVFIFPCIYTTPTHPIPSLSLSSLPSYVSGFQKNSYPSLSELIKQQHS